MRSLLALSVLLSSTAVANAIQCYTCKKCASDFTTISTNQQTALKASAPQNCVLCQKHVRHSEKSVSDRLCMTAENEIMLKEFKIRLDNGCRNTSLIPGASTPIWTCFCNTDFCNSALGLHRSDVWWWLMPTVAAIFQAKTAS